MIENNEKLFLPAQPRGLWDNVMFTKAHKDCIDMMLMFDPKVLSRDAIFKMFFAQGQSPGVVKSELRSFLSSTNAEQYWMARKHQLEVWKGLVAVGESEIVEGVEVDDELPDPATRKDKMLKKAWKTVEKGELDAEVAGKLLLQDALKNSEESEVIESPRRYLPTSCNDCTYKAYIEQLVASGDAKIIEDNQNTIKYE